MADAPPPRYPTGRRPLVDAILIWAHVLVALVVAAVATIVILDGGPAGSRDPQGSQAQSFMGVIQSFAIAPGLVLSLLINFSLLRRHGAAGLRTLERILVVAEFAVIALLQLGVLVVLPADVSFAVPFYGWPVAIILAVAVAIVASRRNRQMWVAAH